jgi:uncharacterized protein (TIRG00374 family)
MEREEGKMTEGTPRSQGRLALVLVVLILLAGGILVALDWGQFEPVLARADWKPVLIALVLTVLSYACVSSAFAVVSRLLGIQMSFRALTETGLVSIVLNHVLTTGGLAGYSVRYILMRRYGVALKDIVAASILHFYLTSLDMITMLPLGFLYLLLNVDLPAGVTALVGLMTLLLTVVAVLATWLIFVQEPRRRFFAAVTRLARKVLHRDVNETFQRLDATLTRGVAAMRRKPWTVVWIMALTWIDWFASVAVVWLCFDALGPPLRVGAILTGYVIGVMAGVLSMLPGGLGVQEGSMAGIFVLLGASFQQALLASILFRGIFFLLPYGVSLVFYGHLLRRGAPQK